MINTAVGAKRIARWFLKLRILHQFDLAEELLREEDTSAVEEAEGSGERPPPGEEEASETPFSTEVSV